MSRFTDAIHLTVATALTVVTALSASAQQVGPQAGSLVIVGGALQDPAIVKRFIDLAGGPDAPIVLVPTAGDDDEYDQYWSGLRQFREQGARHLVVLHTRNPKVADTEAFAKPLTTARGVFFGGGRQWRLADAYLNTRVHRELQALLDRGGVIGGSSAGATILGSFLVRGDTKGNELMVGDHLDGFGFLKNSAIDQHLLRRNRQFDLIEVIEKRPHLLGIGIDEDTAIVVQGDRFDVIGRGYVAIYDAKAMVSPAGRFYLLAPGDRFDLVQRSASRRAEQYRPLERVVPRPNP
ncbi:MAG: cyanophycinase [Acidobacteriota bacterium]